MYVLYPSYTFETIALDERESNELLSAYSALFHPAILERTGEIPGWESAYYPTALQAVPVIVIPPCCESIVEGEWVERRREEGTLLVRNLGDRDGILDFVLENLDLREHGFDEETVADFLALGTTAFLTDLLTRQLRYMSILDNTKLGETALAAAREFRDGNAEQGREKLREAFELVSEAKSYFYPTKTYLLNLLTVDKNDTAQTLRPHLDGRRKTSILLPTATLRTLAEKDPEAVKLLRDAVKNGATEFIGGDWDEGPLFLLPPGEILRRLDLANVFYTELLGRRPLIFGRSRAGLSPILPGLLKAAGYHGVLHFTIGDGWRLGDEGQSVINWQGLDGTKCDALTRAPNAAADGNDYCDLVSRLGRIIDSDVAATVVFAHDSIQRTRWLDDLLRMDRYAPSLGTFTLIEDYFESVAHVGHVKRYALADYEADALTPGFPRLANEQEPQNDPIPPWAGFYRKHVFDFCMATLKTMVVLEPAVSDSIKSAPSKTDSTTMNSPSVGPGLLREYPARFAERLPKTGTERTGLLVLNPLNAPRLAYLDVSDFRTLPQESRNVLTARETPVGESGALRKEIVVRVPPTGFVWVGEGETPEKPVHETGKAAGKPEKTAKGGLFKTVGTALFGKKEKPEPPLVYRVRLELDGGGEEVYYVLRNDFFQVRVDAQSGAVVSLRLAAERGNRMSMQIALRLSKKDRAEDQRSESNANYGYTIMAADRIMIESPGPVTGRLRVEGRLMHPDGRIAARFVQTQTVRRYRRCVEVELELIPELLPEGDPWDAYYAIRWAWGNEGLALHGGVHEGHHEIDAERKRLQLPEFVDLRDEGESLTFLIAGLPFHHRYGYRRLDTLLLVPCGNTTDRESGEETGETPPEAAVVPQSRFFRFAYAHNADDPMALFREMQLPPERELSVRCAEPNRPADWLCFIELKNVCCIDWKTLDDSTETGANTDTTGETTAEGVERVQAVLQETVGAASRFRLRFRRPVAAAYLLEPLDSEDGKKPSGDVVKPEEPEETEGTENEKNADEPDKTPEPFARQMLEIDGDGVLLRLRPYEMATLEVHFA